MYGLKMCLGEEMSPRRSPRSESVWVSLKYCFSSFESVRIHHLLLIYSVLNKTQSKQRMFSLSILKYRLGQTSDSITGHYGVAFDWYNRISPPITAYLSTFAKTLCLYTLSINLYASNMNTIFSVETVTLMFECFHFFTSSPG